MANPEQQIAQQIDALASSNNAGLTASGLSAEAKKLTVLAEAAQEGKDIVYERARYRDEDYEQQEGNSDVDRWAKAMTWGNDVLVGKV
ncbi:hypothetical protein [uncultured Novosphingobium sp.]|uniref:hypothetical protein n=1 Tax=uncultured Novosphingobium sp. TaxID=292277 RepID=UPI0025867C0F|nr:hypothetical protein [uncultured Novosphingobium sp.]